MKAQSFKGLLLIALLVMAAPFKAKAEADVRLAAWKQESKSRIDAALEMAQAEVAQSSVSEDENVIDFSDSGIHIVVVKSEL